MHARRVRGAVNYVSGETGLSVRWDVSLAPRHVPPRVRETAAEAGEHRCRDGDGGAARRRRHLLARLLLAHEDVGVQQQLRPLYTHPVG